MGYKDPIEFPLSSLGVETDSFFLCGDEYSFLPFNCQVSVVHCSVREALRHLLRLDQVKRVYGDAALDEKSFQLPHWEGSRFLLYL